MTDSLSAPAPMATPLDAAAHRRATAVYGETAGLRPALIDPAKSADDPANWDGASAAQLAQTRTFVGIVSDRNNAVHRVDAPDGSNPLETRAWDQAMAAAQAGADATQLDSRITQFVMRQGGDPERPATWNTHLMLSLGPFQNVGGGDVPRGPKTYIDFYGK